MSKSRVRAIVLTMICILLCACGKEMETCLGVYNAVSCEMMGMELDYEGDYIELKKGGKATVRLMGTDYKAKWNLEGDALTVTQQGSEFKGRLVPGAIFLDYNGMEYNYLLDGAQLFSLCILKFSRCFCSTVLLHFIHTIGFAAIQFKILPFSTAYYINNRRKIWT